jgi:hypothetical protein
MRADIDAKLAGRDTTGYSLSPWQAWPSSALGILSPRDSASSLPTGKRQHKPFVISQDSAPTRTEIQLPRTGHGGCDGDALHGVPRDGLGDQARGLHVLDEAAEVTGGDLAGLRGTDGLLHGGELAVEEGERPAASRRPSGASA